MLMSIRSAGMLALTCAMLAGRVEAAQTVECPEGFTKILEQDGEAVCRRSQSVESPDLAETMSQLWWNQAHCNGSESDRQTGVSQNQAGAWTVTMRFFCQSF